MVKNAADLPDILDIKRIGFVFCPEYGGRRPARIEHQGAADLWLFGPDRLPETKTGIARPEVSGGPVGEIPVSPIEAAPAGVGGADGVAATHGQVETPAARSSPPVAEPSVPEASPKPAKAEGAEEAAVALGYPDAGDDPVIWRASIHANSHLMILGLPGMGKTTSLINICLQLEAQGVTPIVFSYHQDIDEKLAAQLSEPPMAVRFAGLGFNPMEVVDDSPLAYLDNAGMLRDIFAAIFPELGDVQLGLWREALKQSYLDRGWSPGQRGEVPEFRAFLELLRNQAKPNKGLLTRLNELDDYGLFNAGGVAPTLLDQNRLALIEIHVTQNEYLQRAFATLVLYNLYQNMFRRGPQSRITHAVIFDEAHRAARLKLVPTMVKECRKYGIAFVVASQEAKDFDGSLFTAVANYLALRLNEADAKLMAKGFARSDKIGLYADRIKQLPKYRAMYYGEGLRAPITMGLSQYSESEAITAAPASGRPHET